MVDAQLPAEEITALKDKMAELVKAQGAEMGEITQWDRRKLAYAIKGKREGVYIFMNLKANTAAVDEVVRTLKLTDSVLRHLVINKTDEK